MSMLSAIFLGLVQGISEFLPISSSGHLSLFQHFLNMNTADGNLFFDVLLHLGTLIAIFVYYWRDILDLLKELGRLFLVLLGKEEKKKKAPASAAGRKLTLTSDSRMILMIIVATIPLVFVLPIKDKVESLCGNVVFIGCALLVTGTILFISDRLAKGKKTAKNATMLDAFLVGVGQAVAVVPGLSRSGTSISAGMLRGFQRTFAVRFSFLMSIPAVLGANIISIKDAMEAGIDTSLMPMYVAGTIVAAVSGYFAIRLVNILADKGKFKYSDCAGVMGHCGICIDTVTYHSYFIRFQTMAVHYPLEHCRIGFAEDDVRTTAGSMLDALLERAAVYENDPLVGRTDAVRVGSDIGNALGSPPCRAAETGIDKSRVESNDKNIGNIVGIVSASFKSGFFELGDHARSAEHKESFGLRVGLLYIVDSCERGSVHIVLSGFNAHSLELMKIIGDRFCGVVGKERMTDPRLVHRIEKINGKREKLRSEIDGPVHVKSQMLDFG